MSSRSVPELYHRLGQFAIYLSAVGHKGLYEHHFNPQTKQMSFSSDMASWAVNHPYYTLTFVLFLCFTGLATVRNSRRLPYPPGPKGYPIIGNLLDVPTEKPWLKYAEWDKTYGERLLIPEL